MRKLFFLLAIAAYGQVLAQSPNHPDPRRNLDRDSLTYYGDDPRVGFQVARSLKLRNDREFLRFRRDAAADRRDELRMRLQAKIKANREVSRYHANRRADLIFHFSHRIEPNTGAVFLPYGLTEKYPQKTAVITGLYKEWAEGDRRLETAHSIRQACRALEEEMRRDLQSDNRTFRASEYLQYKKILHALPEYAAKPELLATSIGE